MNNAKQIQLNLARKWRSKTFDTVVGQDLCLKMLKNSLYKDHYFPVYLFSGQKGCGKTTTARIFAAAVNCERLTQFQQSPKQQSVPCLACSSCSTFYEGKHPDFIEIDAASHTGVDNVRHIIDAASLMPLMGRKKVYLIDEAHMLSKAAFNAFLKILEEPPVSVLFILATTDGEKILETVRSRCFQLFFKSIESGSLIAHIAYICKEENIDFDHDGLRTIISHTAGSARDALNILEQVRFTSKKVTKQTVQAVLGHIDDTIMIRIFSLLLHGAVTDFLTYLKELSLYEYNTEYLWRTITSIARAGLWLKHGVSPKQYVEHHESLKKIISTISLDQINMMLDQLYRNERAFSKSIDQYSVLEMVLLHICQKNKKNNNSNSGSASVIHDGAVLLREHVEEESEEDNEDEEESLSESSECSNNWNNFIKEIENKNDPLVCSLFKQAQFRNFDVSKKIVSIVFSAQFTFFGDLLAQTKNVWQLLLDSCFESSVVLNALFEGQEQNNNNKVVERIEKLSLPKEQPTIQLLENNVDKKPQYRNSYNSNNIQKIYIGKPTVIKEDIDISDATRWPKVHLLQQYFPGTVKEIRVS